MSNKDTKSFRPGHEAELLFDVTFKRLIKAYRSNPFDQQLHDLVWYVYGQLPRFDTFRLIRKFLPHRADNCELYGIMFEMMVYCLTQSQDNEAVIKEVENIIAEERYLNGESYWLHNALGCLSINRGKDNRDAFVHFALGAAKLRGFEQAYHISSGMDAMRPLDYNPDLFSSTIQSSGFQSHFMPSEPSTFVHLVAADPLYFERYIEKLAHSVSAKRSTGVALHAHVVNPTEKTISMAEKLRMHYPWFGFSSDKVLLGDNPTKRMQMAYFASARYIFAEDIINHYDCSIVITDIGIELESDYREVIHHSQKTAAAFSAGVASIKKYYPWVRVCAQLTVFQASPMGRRIARYVSRYITATMDTSPSARNWLVDQIALWHAYEKYQGLIGHTRLSALGRPQK
jgi:hypothetical protein